MPNNELIPWEEDADRLPCQAAAAVTGKKFVAVTAPRPSGPMIPATAQVGASDPTDGGRIQVGPPAAGGQVLGVASWDAAVGEGVTVVCEGVLPVIAGAALTAGQAVQVDATGAAIPLAAGTKVGLAVNSTANGADAEIKVLV
jgi:predicted RecA/RadA family phage recombinase